NKVSAELKVAASKHDFKSLFNILTALKLHNAAGLSEQQQSLYDEASYRLGQNELAGGNTEKAMDYFKKVSVESNHYVSAREIIFTNASPAVTTPSQAATTKPLEKPRKRTRVTVAAPALSSEKVLSIPVLDPEKSANVDSNSSAAVPAESNNEPPTPKFSETDVSQYNRLLGSYFAKRKVSSEPGTEAPSFKEWIKQDKPSF
ncbi:MAG: hypothetical protein K2X81_11260, partial [Candidatus Obscuribacterales bacterium]|nr:hypothetical protein [Candidatus Obscuribacterales bacterium]